MLWGRLTSEAIAFTQSAEEDARSRSPNSIQWPIHGNLLRDSSPHQPNITPAWKRLCPEMTFEHKYNPRMVRVIHKDLACCCDLVPSGEQGVSYLTHRDASLQSSLLKMEIGRDGAGENPAETTRGLRLSRVSLAASMRILPGARIHYRLLSFHSHVSVLEVDVNAPDCCINTSQKLPPMYRSGTMRQG